MSGTETARHRVVQRRISVAKMALPPCFVFIHRINEYQVMNFIFSAAFYYEIAISMKQVHLLHHPLQ